MPDIIDLLEIEGCNAVTSPQIADESDKPYLVLKGQHNGGSILVVWGLGHQLHLYCLGYLIIIIISGLPSERLHEVAGLGVEGVY